MLLLVSHRKAALLLGLGFQQWPWFLHGVVLVEYLEAGCLSIGQPGIAFLPTQRPLQDRTTPGVDQRLKGTAGQDPGLPLRHLRGPDPL